MMDQLGIAIVMNEFAVEVPFCSADAVLMIVLKGSVSCGVGSIHQRLHVGDFIFIHPFQQFTVFEKAKGITMSFHWTEQFLQGHGALAAVQAVNCCSLELSGEGKLEIQNKISKLFLLLSKQMEDPLLAQGIGLTLLGLVRECGTEEYRSVNTNLLSDILRDMHEHYREPLTIQCIAQRHYISPGYLDKLFCRQIGQTPSAYLNDLRMKHAINALLQTKDSVTDIALDHGFSNATTFIKKFKKIYAMTPQKYRNEQHSEEEKRMLSYQKTLTRTVSVLDEQFQIHTAPRQKSFRIPQTEVVGDKISFHYGKGDKPHICTWQTMLNIGWAKDVLLEPIQKQLTRIQTKIPHKYLRFHGIFDEEMRIFSENKNGIYNFRYIDMVFDFVLNIGLLPYVELGFLPKKMAGDSERMYGGRCYIVMPQNIQEWNELVTEFLQHCLIRYGRNSVQKWKFTVMDGLYEYYGMFTMEQYAEFFCNNYFLIKQFDQNIEVGGPGHDLDMLVSSRRDKLDEFLRICQKNGCIPDFICFQYFHSRYDMEKITIERFETHQQMPVRLDENPDCLHVRLKKLKDALQENGIQDIPLVLQAWNATLWQHDLTSDTCYKAAFLAKNILENQSELEMMGYWMVSDLFDDHDPEYALYYGGYGLFTYIGIPKAGYYALWLLSCLIGTMAAQGNGYYVTRIEGGFQLLLYHYTHFDRMYLEHYRFTEDRYGVFLDEEVRQFNIQLHDIPPAYYMMESYLISKDGGSSYDAWIRMGSPAVLQPFQREYLENCSVPVYHTSTEYITGEYIVSTTLKSHEVQLITIRQVY